MTLKLFNRTLPIITAVALSHSICLNATAQPTESGNERPNGNPLSRIDCEDGIRTQQGTCLLRNTGLTEFVCEQVDRNRNDPNQQELAIYTQRRRIPIIRWTATQQSSRTVEATCRQVAIRMRNYYNCNILENLDIAPKPGTISWDVVVKADSNTRQYCPALKPDRAGTLPLITLNSRQEAERIRDNLLDIKIGILDPVQVCGSGFQLSPSEPRECQPIPRPAPPTPKPIARPVPPPPIIDVLPITLVSQLTDVKPTDWAFRALQSLVEKYGCIKGVPNRTFQGNRGLTRYEFAVGLNACLDRILEQIAAATANLAKKEDLETIKQLQELFTSELSVLRSRAEALEIRTASLERQQFSPTTKLFGEAIFAVTNDSVGNINQAVFQNRIRLNLETSFTGKDVLQTRLTAGNASRLLTPDNTPQGTQQFNIGGSTRNAVQIDRLSYLFPASDALFIYVAATGAIHSDYSYTFNPYFEDYDGGNGSLSAFGQESPIYRIGGGAGIALGLKFAKGFSFSLGYLIGPDAANPFGENGFSGNYAVLGQFVVSPSDRFQFGVTYAHGYHRGDTPIFNIGTSQAIIGTTFANTYHFGQSANTDSYGLQAAWEINPRFSVSGFAGYTSLVVPGRGSRLNKDRQDIWYYGLNLAFPDLGKKGNLGGLVFGADPYLGSSSRSIPSDRSWHIEGFYRYQLNDHISITPGIIWITAPNQSNFNDDILIGTVRLTFRF